MHLISLQAQEAHAAGHTFYFTPGEAIHTENYHHLTRQAGYNPQNTRQDAQSLFALGSKQRDGS